MAPRISRPAAFIFLHNLTSRPVCQSRFPALLLHPRRPQATSSAITSQWPMISNHALSVGGPPYPPPPAPSGHASKGPDDYPLNLGEAIATLRADLPNFFRAGLS